ncbi:GHMP kinase [Chytridium lagenaria]|nr:GHMP kinase [Chytridium lagenaria]
MSSPPPRKFKISVPASTSNIGPGLTFLGIALSKRMSVTATLPASTPGIHITYTGDSAHTVPLDPTFNLVTKTALQVSQCHHVVFPSIHVHIDNPIPSGAAVVAGVALANEACGLGMSVQRILDFALTVEGHPDNITASVLGGFVASYVQVMDCPHYNLGHHVQLPISPLIRAVVIIPHFELSTKLARSVLPVSYPRPDVVFNLQRLAVLTASLSQSPPSPSIISEAMQDKLHQSYRQHLVPGLPEILGLTPDRLKGLLGVCVSGAGPTVLCLATEGFDGMGRSEVGADGKAILSSYEVLDVVQEGLVVTQL